MSDNYLRLIPKDPAWQPTAQAAQRTVEALAPLVPGADTVEAEFLDQVTFIDQGANLERVLCPSCRAELDPDWWSAEMARGGGAELGDQTFTDLAVTTPCCSAATSLNDLVYEWPAGFASFEVAVLNPQRGWLEPDELSRLGDLLGHPLRQVMAHY